MTVLDLISVETISLTIIMGGCLGEWSSQLLDNSVHYPAQLSSNIYNMSK